IRPVPKTIKPLKLKNQWGRDGGYVDTAIRLRDSLNECIEFARKYQETRESASDSNANKIV
ncbi:MAG: hypothetical protein QM636_15520, partial [Rhizobium sp.]